MDRQDKTNSIKRIKGLIKLYKSKRDYYKVDHLKNLLSRVKLT